MPNLRRARFSCRSESAARSTPATMTRPLVARSSPIKTRSRVVLPAPEPPMITATSPRATRMLTPPSPAAPDAHFPAAQHGRASEALFQLFYDDLRLGHAPAQDSTLLDA